MAMQWIALLPPSRNILGLGLWKFFIRQTGDVSRVHRLPYDSFDRLQSHYYFESDEWKKVNEWMDTKPCTNLPLLKQQNCNSFQQPVSLIQSFYNFIILFLKLFFFVVVAVYLHRVYVSHALCLT